MTLHLVSVSVLCVDLQDVEDRVFWANQQCGPSIDNSLAAAIISNNLPVHRDTVRQGNKAGTRITLQPPPTIAPPWLSLEQSFSSCPPLFPFFLVTLTFDFPSILEYTKLFHASGPLSG